MKCNLCGKPNFKRSEFCKVCIVKNIEKRAAKARTKARLFRDAIIAVASDNALPGKVNLFLFKKMITLTRNVKLLKNPPKNTERYDFVFLQETADDRAEQLLRYMLSSDKKLASSKSCNATNVVRLLGESMLNEIEAYAKIKNIKHQTTDKQSHESSMLQSVEAKYKGVTYSLAKSLEQLEHLSRK